MTFVLDLGTRWDLHLIHIRLTPPTHDAKKERSKCRMNQVDICVASLNGRADHAPVFMKCSSSVPKKEDEECEERVPFDGTWHVAARSDAVAVCKKECWDDQGRIDAIAECWSCCAVGEERCGWKR